MKVKICGIKTLEDALAAVEAGADMLGYNFYPQSKRYIQPAACTAIQHALQAKGMRPTAVGVFVNSSPAEITAILHACWLDAAQLAGDETTATLAALGERAFKAIRPASLASAEQTAAALPLRSEPPAFLLDAFHPGEYGGTGQTGDWTLAARLAQAHPLLLAGGLNPNNVREAIARVQPWGVDVASGVERAPGVKDPALIREFISQAKKSLRSNHV